MKDPAPPIRWIPALGAIALGAGLMAWAWSGTWQWALTGVATFFVLAVVDGLRTTDRRTDPQ